MGISKALQNKGGGGALAFFTQNSKKVYRLWKQVAYAERITELGWGDVFDKDGLTITAETAMHCSGRAKLASNETLRNFYVLKGRFMKELKKI